MKLRNPASSLICYLLLLALGLSPVGAQEQAPQRERRVVVASSAPSTTGTTRTLEELRARIGELLRQPPLAPAQVAIKVASLDTGRTLYEENAGKLLLPASNLKLYTVAAALDRLSPGYRFTTSVYAPSRPDNSGTVRGDLTIYGRGDPTFAARFNDGDYYRALDELASGIAAAGVRRIEGDIVGDESYFTGPALGSGWEWDDLQWYYGAEVSALTVNDNSLDLFIKPGSRVGDACLVTTGPATPLVTILNHTTTTPRGAHRELTVYRPLGENVIEAGGSLPLDDPGYTGDVAISQPALLFVSMLRTSLERHGITVTGRTRVLPARGPASPLSSLVEIAGRQSPPLSVIAAQTLKPSQNLYAELILRALGKAAGASPAQTTAEAGIAAVKDFLRRAGVNADGLQIVDGSGLSRSDLVTAEATLQLLTFMSRHRYAGVFREALPVAGIDGTLRHRMKGTPAENNLRAKTGTLSNVATLSGYVTSAAGERLVFSLMINNTVEADVRYVYLDAIGVLLASFAGRS